MIMPPKVKIWKFRVAAYGQAWLIANKNTILDMWTLNFLLVLFNSLVFHAMQSHLH